MQFHIIICGLDSVEARRWMNATLVNMVDPENQESLKPLIDGGTEGMHSMSRLFVARFIAASRIQGSSTRYFPHYHFML